MSQSHGYRNRRAAGKPPVAMTISRSAPRLYLKQRKKPWAHWKKPAPRPSLHVEVAAAQSLTSSRIVPPPPSLPLIEESEFRAQSRVQYKNYKKACRSLDWRKLFPNLLHAEANPPHCLALWKADLSGVLNTLRDMSQKNEFGYFLDLALYSRHAISAPAASSFCERVNSHGKLVMTERSTKMKPAKVEERVILRMNGAHAAVVPRRHLLPLAPPPRGKQRPCRRECRVGQAE